MRKTHCLAPILALVLTVGGAPLALGQTFVTMDVTVELAHPPDPLTPVALSVRVLFEPGGIIDPATDQVTLQLHPPDPTVPADPDNARVTVWELEMPSAGMFPCFVERPNGQFRLEDFVACGATLSLFFDDGTSEDVTAQIVSLEANFKPPKGNSSEWRFLLDLEFGPDPFRPTLPPDPVRGSTVFTVGGEFGEAVNSLVSWEASS